MGGLDIGPYIAAAASGFSALVFEILLFRRLEGLLGSSVTATAMIFAAYMAGLALGALLALAPWSRRRPARWYAGLELIVGLGALALVLGLPLVAEQVAQIPPWLASVSLLAVLLIPTAAMGWVLPLLAEVAMPQRVAFHAGFARLYAANTFGAMLGAGLAVLLLRSWGLPVAGCLALLANLLAAGLVWRLPGSGPSPDGDESLSVPRARLWLAAALAGGLMLALEVIWLRALLLQFRGTDAMLAILLCSVIGGLSLGAAVHRRLSLGGWVLLGWAGLLLGRMLFGRLSLPDGEMLASVLTGLMLSVPAALASGAIFARLAQVLRAGVGSSQGAGAGLLVSNTLGAAAGSLLAAHALLPTLGLAHSWMWLIAGYGVLWCVLFPRRWFLGLAVLLVTLVWPDSSRRWFAPAVAQFAGYQLHQRREAVDATLQLARRDLAGAPVAWRLITNSYSMSGTEADSLRYMRLFAQLPQALHADPQSALLISYGLGNTAQALLADRRLQHLTVADTSAATLELSRRIRSEDPLSDPRVRTLVDDGRHVLLRDGPGYDLITAEPPPPRLAGVDRLYSREYFALARQRLNPGGWISHWLPVDQLSAGSSAAVIRAFCAEFADCSLWAGSHYNWMLLGSNAARPSGRAGFERLWQQPQAGQLLLEAGFERPAQLLTSFIADAAQLLAWVGAGPLLDDDHPGRLQSRAVTEPEMLRYFNFMDDAATEQRFRASSWLQSWLPDDLRQQALRLWLWQPILNGQVQLAPEATAQLAALALREGLRSPVMTLLDLSWAELAAGSEWADARGAWYRGVAALLAEQWPEARAQFARSAHPAASALAEVARCFADGVCRAEG